MAADTPMHRPSELILQMSEMLRDHNSASLGVPPHLLNMKPEAYVPQIVCLGLCHNSNVHSSSSMESRISTAEAYKVKSSSLLSQKLCDNGKTFDDIVKMVEQMLPGIARFYDCPFRAGDYFRNFALTITVDSTFLLLFLLEFPGLHYLTEPANSLVYEMISFFRIYDSSIAYDITKLENQIPLFVLKGVFEKVKEALKSDVRVEDFNQLLLERMHTNLTPFWIPADTVANRESIKRNLGDAMAKEPHFLGCLHSFVSQFLQIQFGAGDEDRQAKKTLLQKCNDILEKLQLQVCYSLPALASGECQFLNGISARQLASAGIKFKSFSRLPGKIRVDKDSGTLYLPQIIVAEVGTEVWLRNMVALEFNDTTRSKSVTRYVGLMGCLITSPDDVRLLMDRQVICRGSFALSDECTVKMWNDVRQPFNSTSILRIPDELSKALQEVLTKNYYKGIMKRTFWAIFHYVRSWKFMVPLCVVLGLALTAIQT